MGELSGNVNKIPVSSMGYLKSGLSNGIRDREQIEASSMTDTDLATLGKQMWDL